MKKRPFSKIKEQPLEWLWPGYIPMGTLTLVDGMPEAGKTFALASIAATVSRGGDLPLDAGPSEPGSVLLLSNEDDPARVTKRRLRVMEADQAHVFQIEEQKPIDLAEDWPWLEEIIDSTANCKLLIIDPLNAYLPKANAYRKVAVALHRLIGLAGKHQISIIGVRHVVKGQKKGHPINWGIGSMAYAGRARMILGVAAHPFEDGKRVLACVKSNWGPKPHTLVFTIRESDNGDATVEWLEEAPTIRAEDLMAVTPVNSPPPKLNACIDWLRESLPPEASMRSTELEASASERGFSQSTLKRARQALNLGVIKTASGWEVRWPQEDQGGQKVAQLSDRLALAPAHRSLAPGGRE